MCRTHIRQIGGRQVLWQYCPYHNQVVLCQERHEDFRAGEAEIVLSL